MDTLEKRREEAERQFEILQTDRQVLVDEINKIDTEMARLQGEWRLIQDLTTRNVSKDANKLKIEETSNGKAKKS